MTAHYFDLQFGGPASPQRLQGGTATTALARGFALIHGARSAAGNLAIALPGLRTGTGCHPGNVLRVFCLGRDAADATADQLEQHPFLRDYARTGRVRQVSETFAGPWIEYRRYRIPNRGSRLTEARARRMAHGDSLPFLHMASGSNGQAFSIRVQPIEHAAPPQACETWQPDAYGLSLPSRPFALPLVDIKW